MIIIINDGAKLSLKMNAILELFELINPNQSYFYAFRKANTMFEEKWEKNQLYLSNSLSSNLAHVLLMLVKNPRTLHDGLLRRLNRRSNSNVLFTDGFLSILGQCLGEYFDKSTRQKSLIDFLKKIDLPKVFLIDEFVSIRLISLKALRNLGALIYVSQDVAKDRYNYAENVITRSLMYKLEQDAIKLANLVVASSERDCIKYLEMGAKKAVFYPNIYPMEFEAYDKDAQPSISIVLRGHWGKRVGESLQEILAAISLIDRQIRVYLVGIKPAQIPENVILEHFGVIPDKTDYFRLLSKSWIGINIGVHRGGTNQRRYDYALAGLFVLSDALGARGEMLPREGTYIDSYDLAAKLNQLLKLGKEEIEKMGAENRKTVLFLAKEQRNELLKAISCIVSGIN